MGKGFQIRWPAQDMPSAAHPSTGEVATHVAACNRTWKLYANLTPASLPGAALLAAHGPRGSSWTSRGSWQDPKSRGCLGYQEIAVLLHLSNASEGKVP